MSEVDDIAYRRKAKLDQARADIIVHLRVHVEEYSRGFRDKLGLDLNIQTINNLLRELQDRGFLKSRLVRPPHPDIKGGGGLARRYYSLKG